MALANIAKLGDSLDGINPTIIQQEILASAYAGGVYMNLVTDMPLGGVGMTHNLPYGNSLSFSAVAEGVATTTQEYDIDADALTVQKYTADAPISTEAANYGAADPVEGAQEEIAQAYIAAIDAAIYTKINAETDLDVDHGGSLTLAHFASALQKLIDAKAPRPYYMVLKPADFTALFGGSTLMAQTSGGNAFVGGPSGEMLSLGFIAGFDTYVSPYATKTQFFAKRGVAWGWHPTAIKTAVNGRLGIEMDWDRETRSDIVAATFFGGAVARRNATATPWCGNIYDVP